MRRLFAVVLTLASFAFAPTDAVAQSRSQQPASGWAPIAVGARFGIDDVSNGEVVGAQVRIPVLPSGRVELVPNADITFLPGLKEKQFALDAVFMTGGRSGGLYLGLGYTWRNSIYEGPDRETKTGPSYVLGLRSGTLFGAPFGTQLEVRWIRVDDVLKPRTLTFGVNFPLWGSRGASGR